MSSERPEVLPSFLCQTAEQCMISQGTRVTKCKCKEQYHEQTLKDVQSKTADDIQTHMTVKQSLTWNGVLRFLGHYMHQKAT